MSAKILDGKKRAEEIKESIKKELSSIKAAYEETPKLVALQVKEDAAFSVYTNAQKKVAEAIGIDYELITLSDESSESELIENIESLNNDNTVSGIMVQSPLPENFDFIKVTSSISPLKDVEGLHPEHKGKLLLHAYNIIPPTAASVMELIRLSGVELHGKEAVVIGHSRIVGKPIAMLLLDKLATVTIAHIATSERGNLEEHIKRAEVLVTAVGKPSLVKGELIKDGAIVIDAGISRVDGKIVGDVEFEEANKRASYITPVPGGVGPLTTAVLMHNCFKLFREQRAKK